ncbi:MAG: FitA-like ribbon-helix-helix domain-containing protein [Verrucomicrobiota bacterium]
MPTLTLKGIPTALHEGLKRRALRNRRSLNGEVIACLEQVIAPTERNAAELLEQIRASRKRLAQAGIAPLTDSFLATAKDSRRR